MKFTQRKVAEQLLAQIELIQMHVQNIDNATYCLNQETSSNTNVNLGNLRSLLMQKEMDAWRSLFMWSLTLNNEEQDRIKAAAHERFLKGDKTVSAFLEHCMPGRWIVADKEEFREMARKAFAPKEDKTNGNATEID